MGPLRVLVMLGLSRHCALLLHWPLGLWASLGTAVCGCWASPSTAANRGMFIWMLGLPRHCGLWMLGLCRHYWTLGQSRHCVWVLRWRLAQSRHCSHVLKLGAGPV